jgi:hypothetical protein
MEQSPKHIQVVRINSIIQIKRIFEIIPTILRLLLAIVLAVIAASIVFGMLLRLVGISAFLFVYSTDIFFNLTIIPIFFVSLTSIILLASLPFLALSYSSKDSLSAILILALLCLSCAYLISMNGLVDNDGIHWDKFLTVALLCATTSFASQLLCLIYLRHTDAWAFVTTIPPNFSRRSLRNILVRKRLYLFFRLCLMFSVTILKYLILGSLIWIPFAIISLVAQPVSSLGLLAIFIWQRKNVSNVILREVRAFKATMQRNAGEILSIDHRRPVLLLRSFVDDDLKTSNFAGKMASIIFGAKIDTIRLEECLVELVSRLGPVIALNRPGSSLPELGAARETPTGDWRTLVLDYLDHAQLVIVIYGTGEGLGWEIEEIQKRGYQDKTIMIAPPKSDISSYKVIQSFTGRSDVQDILSAKDRVIAVCGVSAPGTARVLTAEILTAVSYTIALRYCVNYFQKIGKSATSQNTLNLSQLDISPAAPL